MTTQQQAHQILLVIFICIIIVAAPLITISAALLKRQGTNRQVHYWAGLFVAMNLTLWFLFLNFKDVNSKLPALFSVLNLESILLLWVFPFKPILILISSIKWFFIGALVGAACKRLPLKINVILMLIVGILFSGILIERSFGIKDSWKEEKRLKELIETGEMVGLTIQYYSEHPFTTKEGKKQKRIYIQFNNDDSPWFLEEIWPEDAPTYKKGDEIKVYRKMIKYDKKGHRVLRSSSTHNIKTINLLEGIEGLNK